MKRRDFRTHVVNHLYQHDLLGKTHKSEHNEVNETFDKILENLSEIDRIISRNLKNYTIDRLSFVDRAIIRLAVYEMLYTDTAKNIVINEALEITKTYTDLDEKQRAFSNRLLHNIQKEIGD